ncbi:MAG: alpha/beta hydrolase fold [Caulobacteraceae bacterium]|jgi:pimeloyl-ACP methyl ester carboxylesterase|nr:alpha/beta hydrolase fold [Caulobacteraceae bacterium]
MTSAPENRRVHLPSGLVAEYLCKGSGPPLLFLHSSFGRTWTAFLEQLAKSFTVYAPMSPGGVEPMELDSFDGFNDLALFYDDLIRALGLDRVTLVGHSFGGMAAAEYAAYFPERVLKLVLMDALGLWIDDQPVADIHTVGPAKVPALLFADPAGEAAREVMKPPSPEQAGEFMLRTQLAQASAIHFYWPIPDRDLVRRLYRIQSPTLLVWGAEDRVTPPVYAEKFATGISGPTKIRLIEGAGHFAHVEQTRAVVDAIGAFAGETTLSAA